MTEKYDIAVVGATGVVGESILAILKEREFPVGTVYALASERSIGKQVDFGTRTLTVDNLADFDFSQVKIGLFSAGGSISAEYAPQAVAAGCVVIDNTSSRSYEAVRLITSGKEEPLTLLKKSAGNFPSWPNFSAIQVIPNFASTTSVIIRI